MHLELVPARERAERYVLRLFTPGPRGELLFSAPTAVTGLFQPE